jgi:hypothetical protein
MPNKPHKQGPQMTLRNSDDRIVPLKREDQSRGSKPGNAGAGKAVRPSRDSDDPLPTPPPPGDGGLSSSARSPAASMPWPHVSLTPLAQSLVC